MLADVRDRTQTEEEATGGEETTGKGRYAWYFEVEAVNGADVVTVQRRLSGACRARRRDRGK